jgi:hypothetical protein
MSGELPREEKIEVRPASAGAERPYQTEIAGDTVMPTLAKQRSRQQFIACWPFGQQESCDASVCELCVVWQSVDINGDVAEYAARDPCRPMASITMAAMSQRFIYPAYLAPRTEANRRARTLCSEIVNSVRTSWHQFRDLGTSSHIQEH